MAKPVKKTQPTPIVSEIEASQPEVVPADINSFEPDGAFNRKRQKVIHHLFKADIAAMKKNISWTKGSPDLQDVEHVHFFHSVDSSGFPQEYTNQVGGHFHKVTMSIEDGVPTAKCGPPIHKVTNKKSKRSYIVPVQFEDDVSDAAMTAGGRVMREDRHEHKMVYKGYDEVSAESVRDIQRANAQEVIKSIPRNPVNTIDPEAAAREEFEVTESDRA